MRNVEEKGKILRGIFDTIADSALSHTKVAQRKAQQQVVPDDLLNEVVVAQGSSKLVYISKCCATIHDTTLRKVQNSGF